jgi:uncharacterized protein (TIGR01777 family)
MPTVLITGGTGLIGTALGQLLAGKGYEVMILSRTGSTAYLERNASGQTGSRRTKGEAGPVGTHAVATTYHWDLARQVIDPEAIRRADYIVHLAGAGVADKRWNAKRKEEIVKSRTESSALIVKALQEIPNTVKAVVSISGIGWYGPDPSIPNPHPFEETDPVDEDFLGETCRLWESSITPVTALDKRLVILRTGIVLSREGGALAEFKKPVRLGIAAILGSGRQVVSWIHIEDLCRLFQHAIETPGCQGIYNAVSPYPVDNRSLTRELAKRFKGKYFVQVYVPTFILKMVLGQMSIEVLKSTTVSAEKTRKAGFQFNYPSIESALDELTAKK